MAEPLISVEQLLAEFNNNKSWDKQYRLLIQLGKKLPTLADIEKTEKNQVKGCESLAWLFIEKQGDNFYFIMDSDTRVVKGLMMILTIIFQGKDRSQIAAIDTNDIFAQLGLLNHLSPSRANGLFAIINQIKGV